MLPQQNYGHFELLRLVAHQECNKRSEPAEVTVCIAWRCLKRESKGFPESTLIVLIVLRFQLISPISWTDSEPMRPRDNVFQSCQPGTFRNATNSNKCDQCHPGLFQANSDSTTCDLCFGDTYADQFGAPNCTKCAANTQRKTAEPGESGLADSALVCECIPGAHLPLTYKSDREVRHSCDAKLCCRILQSQRETGRGADFRPHRLIDSDRKSRIILMTSFSFALPAGCEASWAARLGTLLLAGVSPVSCWSTMPRKACCAVRNAPIARRALPCPGGCAHLL